MRVKRIKGSGGQTQALFDEEYIRRPLCRKRESESEGERERERNRSARGGRPFESGEGLRGRKDSARKNEKVARERKGRSGKVEIPGEGERREIERRGRDIPINW